MTLVAERNNIFVKHNLSVSFSVLAENSSTDQKQACKKHELYVSFRDLGWQVRKAFLSQVAKLWLGPNRNLSQFSGPIPES